MPATPFTEAAPMTTSEDGVGEIARVDTRVAFADEVAIVVAAVTIGAMTTGVVDVCAGATGDWLTAAKVVVVTTMVVGVKGGEVATGACG